MNLFLKLIDKERKDVGAFSIGPANRRRAVATASSLIWNGKYYLFCMLESSEKDGVMLTHMIFREAEPPLALHEAERYLDIDVCKICGGDCAGANPPVMNCPMKNG